MYNIVSLNLSVSTLLEWKPNGQSVSPFSRIVTPPHLFFLLLSLPLLCGCENTNPPPLVPSTELSLDCRSSTSVPRTPHYLYCFSHSECAWSEKATLPHEMLEQEFQLTWYWGTIWNFQTQDVNLGLGQGTETGQGKSWVGGMVVGNKQSPCWWDLLFEGQLSGQKAGMSGGDPKETGLPLTFWFFLKLPSLQWTPSPHRLVCVSCGLAEREHVVPVWCEYGSYSSHWVDEESWTGHLPEISSHFIQ